MCAKHVPNLINTSILIRMPYTLNSSETVRYATTIRHSQARNPEDKDVIVYEQITKEQDKNPSFLSFPMSQPTHKSHFKTL